MSDYHNNKPFKPTKSGVVKKALGTVKDFFTSRGKNITPGVAINKVPTNVPTTVIQKKIRDLKIGNQKLKSSQAKLDQTIFEMKNNKPFTFKKDKGKSESNREAYKRIQGENTKVLKSMIDKATEKKAKGGRIGYKRGTGLMPKKKSNVDKIKKTFGPKNKLGMQSVIYGLDKNPKITKADPKAKFIAAANKKKKKVI
jgi:hypothetical protein